MYEKRYGIFLRIFCLKNYLSVSKMFIRYCGANTVQKRREELPFYLQTRPSPLYFGQIILRLMTANDPRSLHHLFVCGGRFFIGLNISTYVPWYKRRRRRLHLHLKKTLTAPLSLEREREPLSRSLESRSSRYPSSTSPITLHPHSPFHTSLLSPWQ